jgi:hypothetical protein
LAVAKRELLLAQRGCRTGPAELDLADSAAPGRAAESGICRTQDESGATFFARNLTRTLS